MVRSLIIATALAFCAAQDQEPDIGKLIKQLGSEDYQEREAATEELKKIGRPAEGALKKLVEQTDDPEVKARAEEILEHIGESSRPKEEAPKRRRRSGGGNADEMMQKRMEEIFKMIEKQDPDLADRMRRMRGMPVPGEEEKKEEKKKEKEEKKDEATYGKVPDLLRAHTQIPKGAGVLVKSVPEGSVAAKVGLKKHDVVLEVDGKTVKTPADARAITPKSTVVLLRGGKKMALPPKAEKKKDPDRGY
ncbi:MAG: PDZ domain-containing protein [Planctomycetota bacterium]|jgi:hypothetical protein